MKFEDNIKMILDLYKNGEIDSKEVLNRIDEANIGEIGIATLDYQRNMRKGFPEVVYCEGKTLEQNIMIFRNLIEVNKIVLGTRASKELYLKLKEIEPLAIYNEVAKTITIEQEPLEKDETRKIAIVTAGTSDLPIAEETAVTAEIMGNKVVRINDVGVAGIHRLFNQLGILRAANVIIVVAGMEGALPSVIGGLVNKPIIAVPTSVGYGSNFGGVTALLGMLNSCSSGIAVVNIDNGFGAGKMASIMNHMR